MNEMSNDDSSLWDIMTKTTDLVKSLKQGDESDNIMEMARDIECSTNGYACRRQNYHPLSKEVNHVRETMHTNQELLKKAISNASLIKYSLSNEFNSKTRPLDLDLKDVTKDNIDAKLRVVNNKIKQAVNDLRSKTRRCTRFEKMLQEYSNTLGESIDLFQSVPNLIKNAKIRSGPKRKAIMQKVGAESTDDDRAKDLLGKMSSLDITYDRTFQRMENQNASKKEQPGTIGDWIDNEGFNSREELNRFKELYKKITGKDPDEDDEVQDVNNNLKQIIDDENINKEELEFIEKVFRDYIQER